MNLKFLWQRYKAQRRAGMVAQLRQVEATKPKPFRPLTQDESLAVLEDAVQWLIDEARATLAMPNGLSKERRRAELRARDKAMARDFLRLVRKQEG